MKKYAISGKKKLDAGTVITGLIILAVYAYFFC